jgi:hypothetical protein
LKQLEDFFQSAIDSGEEGIVVKDLTSPYVLAARPKTWVKMKPDYSNKMSDIDVIVLGAYFGEGRDYRGKGINQLLLGVKSGSGFTSEEVRYETLCKVGSGFTREELEDLRRRVEGVKKVYDYKNPPRHLAHWTPKTPDDRPAYYIMPEDSFVVTIKCFSIETSRAFSAGLTPRFPRVTALRYDKPVSDIITLQDALEMKQRGNNEPEGDEGDEGDEEMDEDQHRSKRRKPTVERKRKNGITVDAVFMLSKGEVKKEKNCFLDGMKFWMPATAASNEYMLDAEAYKALRRREADIQEMSNSRSSQNHDTSAGCVPASLDVVCKQQYTKEEIVDLIRRLGGEVIANAAGDALVVVGKTRHMVITCTINAGRYDVVDFSYILHCAVARKKLPLKSADYVGMSAETRLRLEGEVDLLGDSYTEDIEPHELLKLFNSMNSRISKLRAPNANASAATAPKRQRAGADATTAPKRQRAGAGADAKAELAHREADLARGAAREAEVQALLSDYQDLQSIKCYDTTPHTQLPNAKLVKRLKQMTQNSLWN